MSGEWPGGSWARWGAGFLATAALAACAPAPPAAAPAPPAAVEVRDDHGHTLRLAAPARRIVSLAPAHTETLYAIGAGDALLAADTYSDYPPQVRARATLNCWPKPPLEQLAALRPDAVLVFAEETAALQPLREAGLPVVKLFPRTVDEAMSAIAAIGRLAGRDEAAIGLVRRLRDRMAAVRRDVEGARPRTFVYELDALDPGRPFVAGGGGLYSEVMRAAGGRNVFADLEAPAAQVSAEQVVARRPEVLFLGDTQSPVQPQSPELVRRRPGWGSIPAVREGRIYPLDSNLLTRPGPRLAQGMETVARLLHPERFP